MLIERQFRTLATGLLVLVLPAIAAGCSALATAMWVVQGPNVPAEFKGLSGKTVAVVCRPSDSSLYAHPNVGKELAREVARLLRRNVRKIDVVLDQKVAEWMDENTWNDYTEVGKALNADLVVAIDLNSFRIYQGQTIFQGRADVTMRVFDCATSEVVFERRPPEIVYPPNHVISASEVHERDFRNEFIKVVADQLARYYYPHDPRAHIAMDAAALR